MKNIVMGAAIVLFIVVAAIFYLLYKVGKEMNYYRCGCKEKK